MTANSPAPKAMLLFPLRNDLLLLAKKTKYHITLFGSLLTASAASLTNTLPTLSGAPVAPSATAASGSCSTRIAAHSQKRQKPFKDFKTVQSTRQLRLSTRDVAGATTLADSSPACVKFVFAPCTSTGRWVANLV
ncbi:hypothetical protein TRVL_10349 [Trypanosoma vivax]|nr:hypothetical protein TRVL_10349 [Trypanosoma vivax]